MVKGDLSLCTGFLGQSLFVNVIHKFELISKIAVNILNFVQIREKIKKSYSTGGVRDSRMTLPPVLKFMFGLGGLV